MIQLTDTQFVEGTLEILNKKGNPAKVQAGSESFTASDPAVVDAALTGTGTTADPYKVKVSAKAGGASRVSFTADADLGDGVQTIEIFEDFSVVAGLAVGGRIVFGPPQEQA